MSAPIWATWEGDAWRPLPRFARECDANLVVGERYHIEVIEERSAKTHKHQFAAIHEAWLSLPDHLAERFQSSESLRKFALIKAGFCDSQTFVASSKAEAARLAAFIRPLDEFAVITVSGATVTRFTAKSQSVKAMGREEFQRSKSAVLEIVAEMIGVSPDALSSHARGIAA